MPNDKICKKLSVKGKCSLRKLMWYLNLNGSTNEYQCIPQ